jgi:uncharacterized membrane protein (UPF0127 family)
MTRAGAAAALLLCSLSVAAPDGRGAEPARLLAGFARAQGMIETRQACHLLDLYVADAPEQRAQGLMYIRELGEFEGMLFPGPPAVVSMWMRNTYIPLDMLFIRENGTIARVAAETTPFSEDAISSGEPVTAVLELNGGFTTRHGVRTGDRFRIVR